MAHPKRQHSRQRQRKRRTHQGAPADFGDLSMQGSPMGYNHRVDPITGMYKGKQIITIKEKKVKEQPE